MNGFNSRAVVGEALRRHCISFLWLHFPCGICSPSVGGSWWISVCSFLCTCNAWVFRCLFFFFPSFLPGSNKIVLSLKTPREVPVLFPKFLYFPPDWMFGVCVRLCVCVGGDCISEFPRLLQLLFFFPNKLLKYEFSLLKDLGCTWNRGLHI